MENLKITLLFALVVFLILITGFVQSWNTALLILNMGLISAIMSLGVNLQWGFAGLFNVGIMGFVALGGLAAVLVSAPPVYESWSVGGIRIIAAIIFGVFVILNVLLCPVGIIGVSNGMPTISVGHDFEHCWPRTLMRSF